MSLDQLAKAAFLAGRGDMTEQEIARAIGYGNSTEMRKQLGNCGVRLGSKPFGQRRITIDLPGPHYKTLCDAADARSRAGADRCEAMAKELLKIILSPGAPMVDAILDDGHTTGASDAGKVAGAV